MQILLVALSRRMCCSRVWRVRRRAGLPAASFETPTRRPGRRRLCSSRVAKNAACGPPNPGATPKRWLDPMTTSAPHSPGGLRSVRASKSVATIASAPDAWVRVTIFSRSQIEPSVAGYWKRAAKTDSCGPCSAEPVRIRMPRGSARVCRTARVCGWTWSATKIASPPLMS